ncbi:MmgE/PrpD family protein [Kribbella turkmenica]|uniref:MmgE/PrpD family protein n=1 Tax=Kribbella turkmenica TaxID=2530375 RepID=A0A4R4XBQ0_9ACTN|nr:MmgE/PrpD family protein [Kribbella turkmenica]TDD27892.1 MmgE/PrpD family protein [Kribbella turkmenica]
MTSDVPGPIAATAVECTAAVAEYAATTSDADIPEAASLHIPRLALLDTVGVALAGGTSELYHRLAATLDDEVGTGPSTVFAGATQAPPRIAALLNGAAAHALDYDDATYASYGHPSAVLMPALLASGEESGAQQLGSAYAVGLGVIHALSRGVDVDAHYRLGWHATATIGLIGATAATSRLLGLDTDKTRHAVGIAASLAGGSRSNFGTMTKPLHVGMAASNAVLASSLAARGFTANPSALEAKGGYFALFGCEPQGPELCTEMLKLQPWHFLEDPPHFKLYPCCFNTHRGVTAAMEIHGLFQPAGDDIESVRVTVEPEGLAPLIDGYPPTGLQAKFSMAYVVAAALLDGRVTLSTFDDEVVQRPDLRAVAERTTVHESSPGPRDRQRPANVQVSLRDGRSFQATAELGRQDHSATTRELLSAKFRDCLDHSDHAWNWRVEDHLWRMVNAGAVIRFPGSVKSATDPRGDGESREGNRISDER